MEDYVAVRAGVIYNGDYGIVGEKDFCFKAEDKQEAIDLAFSIIVNDDEMHQNAFEEICSNVREYSNADSLKKIMDEHYYNGRHQITLEVYERKIIDRKELAKEIDNEYYWNNTNKPIFVKDLTDIEILKYFVRSPFYDLEWSEDILNDSGFLNPIRLNDGEIKKLLQSVSKYNPELKIEINKLEQKVFLI